MHRVLIDPGIPSLTLIPETLKVQIEKIKAKLDANIMDDADYYLSLGQLSKITKELNGLLSQVGELQGRIREKGSYLTSRSSVPKSLLTN